MIIGVAAGTIPYFAVAKLKAMLGYDDALDTFGVHAVGGTLGALLTGILADEKVNSVVTGVKQGWSCLRSRPSQSPSCSRWWHGHHRVHRQGCRRPAPQRRSRNHRLDLAEHGEEGYHILLIRQPDLSTPGQ
jgi:Amt family ammonium transporter